MRQQRGLNFGDAVSAVPYCLICTCISGNSVSFWSDLRCRNAVETLACNDLPTNPDRWAQRQTGGKCAWVLDRFGGFSVG